MTILQAANNGGERRAHDFYPTPPECVAAILPALADFPRKIWEPACGDGGIALPLEAAGYNVIGTDLVQRDYGIGGVDFLKIHRTWANAIVTNPPFGDLADPFVDQCLFTLDMPYVALLLNVNFWHAAKRNRIWAERRPRAIYALCWKPDFTGAGRPYFNCIWTVWGPPLDTWQQPETKYFRLVRPR